MYRDDELYQRYLSGDTVAYDTLMLRHGDRLVLYLNGYLHDWQDAEDLMIEAFAQIMVKKPTIRAGNFKAYLYRTARNLASRFHTSFRKVRVFSLEAMALDEQLADGTLLENRLEEQERARTLHRCLARIEPTLREALWLVYFEGLSYAQTAEVMRVNSKRVEKLLARGKEHLRTELEREGMTHAYE
jgi:RNA polymerase sigma-70 factor (ECF subfamily)